MRCDGGREREMDGWKRCDQGQVFVAGERTGEKRAGKERDEGMLGATSCPATFDLVFPKAAKVRSIVLPIYIHFYCSTK
jgi:hypothetical protein